MLSNLDNLPITEDEVESLVEQKLSETLAIDIYRAFFLKNSQQIFSVLQTEFFLLFLFLIVVMPLTVITIRNLGYSPFNVNYLLVILGISLLAILSLNLYLWQKAMKLKYLAKLMEEIEKYNSIVKTLKLMENIESVQERDTNETRTDAIEALKITRASLINALRVEGIIRKNQNLLDNRYELLTDLENNFATLMDFEVSDRGNDYGRLLNDALKIGMSVQKEIRKLR